MIIDDHSIFNYLHFSSPTEEQINVLKALQEFVQDDDPYDFFVLCGSAGTGKTSLTSALIGYLNSIRKDYLISAPTGRAARIIGRKTNATTSTIHSLIYNTEHDIKTDTVTCSLKSNMDEFPSVYIVDEASMISGEKRNNQKFISKQALLFDLISFIKKSNVKNKIIFLGDKYQLPPIFEKEALALNKEFLESTFNLKGSAHLLTEVKRQQDGSYILLEAERIKKGIDEKKDKVPFSSGKNKNIHEASKSYVKNFRKEGPENAIAIGVSHKANKYFNDLVRQEIFGWASKILEKGDLLLVLNNWSRNGQNLYNGDHVQLLNADFSVQEVVAGLHFVPIKVKVLFSKEEEIIEDYVLLDSLESPGGAIDSQKINALRAERYTKNPVFRDSENPRDDKYVGALRLTYGHAITCNKAQGGEWEKVYINKMGIPSLKWQYTATTRGKSDIEPF